MLGGCHVQPEQFFNLIFGYYGQYQERDGSTTMPAGISNYDLSPVPAGEMWMVSCIYAKNDTRGCGIRLKIVCGANVHDIKAETTTAAAAVCSALGAFPMAKGDYVRITFRDVILNDTCYWGALGYKMKISQ